MADWESFSRPEQLTQVGLLPLAKVSSLLKIRGLDATGSEKRQRSRLVAALARELARAQEEEASEAGTDEEGQADRITADAGSLAVPTAGAEQGVMGREKAHSGEVQAAVREPLGASSPATGNSTRDMLDEIKKDLALMQGRIVEHVADQLAQLRDEMAREAADQERRLIDLVNASRYETDDHPRPRGPRQEMAGPGKAGTGLAAGEGAEVKGPRSVDELLGLLRHDDAVARVLRETGAQPPTERVLAVGAAALGISVKGEHTSSSAVRLGPSGDTARRFSGGNG